MTFKNGVQKEIDLEPYLYGPIFEPIKSDLVVFRSAKVIGSTIGWDNGASIDPDVLYYSLTTVWMEEAPNETKQQWPLTKAEPISESRLVERY